RGVVSDDAYIRAGHWGRGPMPSLRWSVEGKTIGILGLGRIGRTLAAKLQAFGCEVLYHGRRPQPDQPYEYCADLTAMARRAKALILTCPGGPATAGIVTREVIDALGPEGFLINVARGEVVDEVALIAALQEGRLGQAALDVFAEEPHVPEALRALPNVILTPHVASATVETRGAMFNLCADNVRSWFASGRALTPVPEQEGWAPA
ncbi:MAG: NAD(P)-dependent oxidoreductase, partial [Proteobacteria bacterium]|nr:NAD(P)-dependent oxidoreductase [Pseudomonadota bacterium]